MHNVLLVEDSVEAHELVKRALGNSLHVEWAKSLNEASVQLQKRKFDLVLLDVMLPDGDGYRLCSIMQTSDQLKKIPVIFLTAKVSTSDKVMGFSIGAEDYITKPFDPLELRARVESRLRKNERDRLEMDILRLGDLEINLSSQTVQIIEDGKSLAIDLTPIEFKLLLLLSKDLNKVFSRDEILDAVWGQSIHVYARSVDTHISKLRKKLLSKGHYIESVHGSGYRLSVHLSPNVPQLIMNGQPLLFT